MQIKNQILLALLLIFLFFLFFLLSIPYFSGDVTNHIVWGRSILEDGPKGFYGRYFHDYSFPNYPPISMFSFAAAVWIFDRTQDLVNVLNNIPAFPSQIVHLVQERNIQVAFLKIPAIIPFILSGAVVFSLGRLFKKTNRKSLFFTLIFLFNPAFFYLAVIWGQNDFAQVLFILLAILFLFKKNFYPAAIFAGLSILSKQTVLMVWGLFILNLDKVFNASKTPVGFAISMILLWLFYLPFNEGSLIWPFTFYNETLRSTGLLVADNAINFWGVLSRFGPADSQEVIFIKLEYWGYLFFALLLLPLLYKYFKEKFTVERFIYFLFMASIIYFFTLTRMHERYIIFGAVFAHLLTMINKKYLLNLIFFSGLLLLNMYKGLLMPSIPILRNLLNSTTFLSILGISYLIILCFNYVYFVYRVKNEKE